MNTAAKVEQLLTDWKQQGIIAADMCVKLAEACMGFPYIFGDRGSYCTVSHRQAVYNKAPDKKEYQNVKKKCQVLNSGAASCSGCKFYPGGKTYAYDCRGFTYWVILKVTGKKIMGAGATSQYNDNSNWSEKGEIANMPNVVCCVFQYNKNTGKMEHTGLHVGNGRIIHCSNGVQTGKTTDKGWTHYAIPVALSGQQPIAGEVPTKPTTTGTTLKKGSKGDKVVDVQKMLMQLGYDLPKYGADGSFGNETLAAVKAFQKDYGLTVDGMVGQVTLAALQKAIQGDPIPQPVTYTVVIPNLDAATAEALVAKYPGAVSNQSV